jgi:hypothetical protein
MKKICSMCQKEYTPFKGDQVTCSKECRMERKRITERIKQKEARDRNSFSITFPCMNKDCNVPVTRSGQSSNRKFCDDCGKKRKRDIRIRTNRKRYAKIVADRGILHCQYCDAVLGKYKRKFCNNQHFTKYHATQNRRRILTNKIRAHQVWIDKFQKELDSL